MSQTPARATGMVGYAAASEQFTPTELLDYAVHAEANGFTGVMAADHYQPWVPAQGQSGFVWSYLTAVAERTKADFGPGVTAPTFRMHPAVVAQASATLASMYPGRHWLGLGAGEALNEHIVGQYWPEVGERSRRLWEAVEIISKLFTGKDVKHAGEFFRLETTRLWTMPMTPPPIHIATAGPLNAYRTGKLADGIITVGAPLDKVANLLARFDSGARDAGKRPDTMTKVLQLHLSWAETDEMAMANALREWPNGGMKFPKSDIRSPHDFAAMADLVRPEDFAGRMIISSDPDDHRANIQRFLDLGFDRVYLHNVGRNQCEWVETFGREVLPALHR